MAHPPTLGRLLNPIGTHNSSVNVTTDVGSREREKILCIYGCVISYSLMNVSGTVQVSDTIYKKREGGEQSSWAFCFIISHENIDLYYGRQCSHLSPLIYTIVTHWAFIWYTVHIEVLVQSFLMWQPLIEKMYRQTDTGSSVAKSSVLLRFSFRCYKLFTLTCNNNSSNNK